VVAQEHGLAVGEILSYGLFVALFARVDKNLAGVDMGEFAVLKNVAWGSIIAFLFPGEAVDSDAVVRVVAISGNEFSSSTNA